MQPREKMLLCVAPLAAAGYLWFSLTNPAIIQHQEKSNELKQKEQEQIELKQKLFDLKKLESKRAALDAEISALRGSVPKNPDIDLLLIDLEKMCLESGMDVIGVEPPEKEKEKKLEELEKASLPEEEGVQAKAPQAKQPAKPAKPADKAKAAPETDIGLNKLVKQVTLTGDYPGLIELMRKLESYQRVIGINQVEAELPPEVGGKGKLQDVRHIVVTFLMTAYYLP